jgi:S-(hydroxymethyl)glutathione dehydrogenase/alcohol dehydrogenase
MVIIFFCDFLLLSPPRHLCYFGSLHLSQKAGCIVESVGENVTSVTPGDHIIPCYTPQCCEASCIFCQSPKTNLCPKIRSTQGQGVMPDGTVRFHDAQGQPIYHFMGCSTMAEYTVLAEISCAKINPTAPLNKMCLFGCGVSTGLGAVWNTCKVEVNSSVAVFGVGAVGLAVIQGAKMAGASKIIAVDINPTKLEVAKTLGATDCICPTYDIPEGKTIVSHIAGTVTPWGVDYTFDCTGNVAVMRDALECSHRGWGTSCVIGVAASGHEIATRPFFLVTGRVWKGTAFGGFKSRRDVPWLVDKCMKGELPIDHFITHTFQGVDKTNEAIDALHGGNCLRAVVEY